MSPARWPRARPEEEKLLIIDSLTETWEDARIADLPLALRAGDLLVVNDAATLPASMPVVFPTGVPGELRLLAMNLDESFECVLFGPGTWRSRTEDRPAAERVRCGDTLECGSGLHAHVESVSPPFPCLVRIRFNLKDGALWGAIYKQGVPVQYAYMEDDLPLWHVQNRYASRPWAMELPSAGRPLTWSTLLALADSGVHLAPLTHAAGLSSTGDAQLDALLPLPERYDIPAKTVEAILETNARGGRVVAVGTSVVRAVEGNARDHCGTLTSGSGVTDLRIDGDFRPRLVQGLLTGMHEKDTSHFALLQAFAPPSLLHAAYAHAEAHAYLVHEFGDSNLILG
jgi:S-adenosylmethionine:tRNA ribosyltransferase-isomerase